MARPAVFLDRDGTVIEEVNYLKDPNEVRLLPLVIPALQSLQRYFPLVIITNQAGIAKGYLDEKGLQSIHSHLETVLTEAGIRLTGIYYCPHHPKVGALPYRQNCRCRKPQPGMLLMASHFLNLHLPSSYTIGDKLSDISAGINAGTYTALVRTGYGREHERQIPWENIYPDFVGDNLLAVANWILNTGL
ncbi:MAG: HAD family hydrolase [Firmicutes bacterium]|nr:HAD family hydrolase [Bacillota bacterium]